MTLSNIGLALLAGGYAAFLIYDELVQHYRFGKTLVAMRLKRRAADAVFLCLIVAAGLYYEFTQGNSVFNRIALVLLMDLILYHGLRYPKWRLKAKGFTFGGRYWTYAAIKSMQLSEDGVLLLTLVSGQQLYLPAAHLRELERAAAFFAGEEALNHFLAGKNS